MTDISMSIVGRTRTIRQKKITDSTMVRRQRTIRQKKSTKHRKLTEE